MSFPKYAQYKHSNTDFLGQVPVHWKVERLKHCAEVFPSNVDKKSVDGQVPVKLCNYTDVYYNDIIGGELGFMLATATEEQAKRFELQQGDVVFTKDSESADDIGVAAFVSKRLPGVIYGYHLSIARANGAATGEFLKQYFDSQETKSYFAVSANGLTRVGLGQYAVDNAPIALPTVEEQTQIADFLNHETAKIDTLIHEQKRLIELLKEKRQAVISHAVTKGLDPDAPMKDSGVEWLGEVPAHWEVRKLSSITDKITNGYVGPTRGLFVDEGVNYLQSLHIKNNEILFNQPYFVSLEWSNAHSKSILREGDVLIVQTGDIGQSAVVTKEFAGSNCHALIVVSSVHPFLDGNYLSWVLNSPYGKNTLLSIQTGALHPHLNCGYVKDVWIPLPPAEEQQQIVNHLERELASFQGLTEQAAKVAKILRERRTALISAAVTGKIDVRKWQLPADGSTFDEEVQQAGMETTA